MDVDSQMDEKTIYIDRVVPGRHNVELVVTGAMDRQPHHRIHRHFFVADPDASQDRFLRQDEEATQSLDAKRQR